MRRTSVRSLLIAAVASSAPLLPLPAFAEVIPLEVLEKRALELRPTSADDARARATAADIRKAASAYYPQLSMKADSNVAPGRTLIEVAKHDPDRVGAPRDEDIYLVQGAAKLGDKNAFEPQIRTGVDFNAAANIYDFGRTKAAVRAGEAAHNAVRASAAVTREALVHQVRGAYLNWLLAVERARLATESRDDSVRRLNRVRGLVDEGVRPPTDLAPAETETLLAELELTRALSEKNDAELLLGHAVGEALPSDAEPDLSLLERELPGQIAPEQDAAYRALTLQREAAYAAARAAKKERYPLLTGALSLGMRVQQNAFFPIYGAGIGLAIPLWDGGLASANSEAQEARGDELTIRMQERARDNEFALRRARMLVDQAKEQLAVAMALRDQCQKRLTQAEEGYHVGALSIDQVYQARAVLRRAESEVLAAQAARAKAVLEVAPVTTRSP